MVRLAPCPCRRLRRRAQRTGEARLPVTLAPADRKLVYIAIAIVVVMVVTLSLLSPRQEEEGTPSSYSTLKGGGKAASLLLAQSGYHIERWEQSPMELPV